MLLHTVAFLLFAALTFSTGDAIKCYDCNSRNNSHCASEDPTALAPFGTDCSLKPGGQKYTLCRKIVQFTELGMNGLPPHIRIIRSCGWENFSTPCYVRTYHEGGQTVCACNNKDFCNSAATVYVSFLLVTATVVVSFFSR